MVKPAIVIVDDFPQVLHKLKNDLEPKYSDHFRIIGANSGQQALDQLKQMNLHNEPVALLLVDEQMPEMGGSEFLKEARDLYPRAKRILLTTYAVAGDRPALVAQRARDHGLSGSQPGALSMAGH